MCPEFGPTECNATKALIKCALEEDIGEAGDVTSPALIGEEDSGTVQVVAREEGVLAGGPVAQMVFAALDADVSWNALVCDGAALKRGSVAATVTGRLRALLSGERTALNFLTHLSGVATLTRKFVDAAACTRVNILDTRKTLPGYRLLEKYAVRCGGGTNHRFGLHDGVLIKDNHLAAWSASAETHSLSDAIRQARNSVSGHIPIEIEVDTLDQLRDALSAEPDIVLLDNMDVETLREAIRLRDEVAPLVQLEASGSVTLDNVAAIAQTGVERISIGALTHSAPALDLAFDWKQQD